MLIATVLGITGKLNTINHCFNFIKQGTYEIGIHTPDNGVVSFSSVRAENIKIENVDDEAV